MTSVGFFGLPSSGKSTVFHALTRQAVSPQFLGYDLKPHQAVVKIPDARLDWLTDFYKSRSKVNATMEFVDIPGFDPASTERKLMTSVLEHYRKCDALVLVVNLFDPAKAADAATSVRNLLDELVVLGMETAEKSAKRLEKQAKMKTDKEATAKYELLNRVKEHFEEGIPVRRMELQPEQLKLIREYAFLSEKPVIAVLNVADEDFSKPDSEIAGMTDMLSLCREEKLTTIRMSASLESELADMEGEEAAEYMAEFGVTEPSLPRFIRAAFECLGLITFLTGSDKECRSWSLRRGANAQGAAGVIHTDMAKGFIRAETIAYDDLVKYGSFAEAKADGKVRLEGKEYIVADGDIMNMRFNV